MLGIIGGSGLYALEGLRESARRQIDTPWGNPSDELVVGALAGQEVVFLPRHARGHSIAPHRINYRANVWALREVGASAIVAVAACGGIAPDCSPGRLVIPDQIIDYTHDRAATFFDQTGSAVTHIDFTEPYDTALRARLALAAKALRLPVVEGGVYGCTNGPRLETAAEIRRLARDGCSLVGMTGMPEAALARELGLPYVCLAVVANSAAGVGESGHSVSMDQILQTLKGAMADVQRVLLRLCSD